MLRRLAQSESSNARHAFLVGERSLRAYLAGGSVDFLKDAEANLSSLRSGDRSYETARYYLGIIKTQFRETRESIRIFEELRKGKSDPDFKAKVSLRLALRASAADTPLPVEGRVREEDWQELERGAELSFGSTVEA
jgi:hypothetical protein